MAKRFKMCYPFNNANVICLSDKTKTKFTFVAHGSSAANLPVTGIFTDDGGNNTNGQTVMHGRNWIIVFANVPAGTKSSVTVTDGFHSPASATGLVIAAHYDVTVTYPNGGANVVGTTFTCFGNITTTDDVIATMTDDGGNMFTGTTISDGAPDGSSPWIVQFTGLNPGTYTLAAIAGSAGQCYSPVYVTAGGGGESD